MTNKTRKLPPAKDWRNRDIDDWNVTTFTEYLRDKHRDMYGCEYVPFGGGWAREQGMLGRLIGTKAKKGTHDKRLIKEFIDDTFATYNPTPQYPGTSFGFLYTYRRNVLQKLEADASRRARAQEWAKEQRSDNDEDLDDWF